MHLNQNNSDVTLRNLTEKHATYLIAKGGHFIEDRWRHGDLKKDEDTKIKKSPQKAQK